MFKSLSKVVITFCIITGSIVFGQAQQIKYGFKVGLNFSNLNGPVESNSAGDILESHKNNIGFHAGGGIRYQIDKKFAVGLELLYSQKGGKNFFNSDSSYLLIKRPNNLAPSIAYGKKDENIRISISYIDFPLNFYYKFKKVEFSVGANVGIMVNSGGVGESTFSGQTTSGSQIDQFITSYTYNYVRDAALEYKSTVFNQVVVDGDNIPVPSTLGAYYFYDTKDGNLIETIDVGLNFGLSYYFNDALYLGLRYNYGLSDITNNYYGRSNHLLDPQGNYIKLNNYDRNVSTQISVGFSF
ncbi:MAG: PorT family protein [Saprospiraceae bacterium]|nr:PorT family protein [Saprospiraceae bacterium]